MSNDFIGKARALTSEDLNAAVAIAGCTPAELWTVVAVETSGCGYQSNRRPQILYERHVFHRLTNGKYDSDPEISAPTPFEHYGPGGDFQYARLIKAAALDRPAAIRSASWGLGQIMGENAQTAGFADAESMVAAMLDSEAAQFAAVAGFIKNTHIAAALTAHNWVEFAKGYNGKSYEKNKYDENLAAGFAKYSTESLPDFDLRAAQLYLTFGGYNIGAVDGIMGSRTRNAILAFQRAKNMVETGKVDAALIAALENSY